MGWSLCSAELSAVSQDGITTFSLGCSSAALGLSNYNGMEGDTIQKVYIYIYNMYNIYIYIILYKFLDGETVEVNLLFFWLFDSSWKWPGSGLSLVEFTKWIVRGARVPRISPQPSGHRILVIYPMIRPPKANRRGRCPDLGARWEVKRVRYGFSEMEVFRDGGIP